MLSIIDDHPDKCPECGEILLAVEPDPRPDIVEIWCPGCGWETERAEVRVFTLPHRGGEDVQARAVRWCLLTCTRETEER